MICPKSHQAAEPACGLGSGAPESLLATTPILVLWGGRSPQLQQNSLPAQKRLCLGPSLPQSRGCTVWEGPSDTGVHCVLLAPGGTLACSPLNWEGLCISYPPSEDPRCRGSKENSWHTAHHLPPPRQPAPTLAVSGAVLAVTVMLGGSRDAVNILHGPHDKLL